jgi:23S rRNA pseudouridine1911/1915/1917 synthase
MNKPDDGIKHFTSVKPNRLIELVHKNLDLPNEECRNLLKLGAIYVNNVRQEKDKIIAENSVIRIHTKPRRYNCDYAWSSLIIFENDFFLVINKPSGVPSHPLIDNCVENALTQVSLARNFSLFVTNRLDTLTSGLIVFAKKSAFAKDFNLQLQRRSIQKKYVALVESTETFPNLLRHYMDPSAGTPKKLSVEANEDWPICELEILEQRRATENKSWVKINLLTGRTHQIRSQFAFVKAPIFGDHLYGATTSFHKNAIALRCYQLEFSFAGEKMIFTLDQEFN